MEVKMFNYLANNKLKKYIVFIVIVIFICLFRSSAVNAEVTPLKSIDERVDCVVNDVSFKNFHLMISRIND